MKRCYKCKKHKSDLKFYSNVGHKDKLSSYCRLCDNARKNKAEIFDPRKGMFRKAKHHAKIFGLPFNISLKDIIIPDLCPVFNIKLVRNIKIPKDNSPSLDKIIPSLGYVLGNIQVISNRANRIKSDASIEELESIISYLKTL